MNNPAEWRPSGSRFNLTDDSSYNLEEASSTEARTEKECVVSARQRRSGAAERPKTGGQISGMFGKFKRDGSFCLTELKGTNLQIHPSARHRGSVCGAPSQNRLKVRMNYQIFI